MYTQDYYLEMMEKHLRGKEEPLQEKAILTSPTERMNKEALKMMQDLGYIFYNENCERVRV